MTIENVENGRRGIFYIEIGDENVPDLMDLHVDHIKHTLEAVMDIEVEMSDGKKIKLAKELVVDMQKMHKVNAKYEIATLVYPRDNELAQELESRLENIGV